VSLPLKATASLNSLHALTWPCGQERAWLADDAAYLWARAIDRGPLRMTNPFFHVVRLSWL